MSEMWNGSLQSKKDVEDGWSTRQEWQEKRAHNRTL